MCPRHRFTSLTQGTSRLLPPPTKSPASFARSCRVKNRPVKTRGAIFPVQSRSAPPGKNELRQNKFPGQRSAKRVLAKIVARQAFAARSANGDVKEAHSVLFAGCAERSLTFL